jgi:Protein of unknown function (DUF3352)
MPRLVRRPVSAILLACVAIAAALIAGCGGGGGGGGSADVGPAAIVPANTPLYVDATVKPTGSAQSDARAALGKVMDTSDPGGKIVSLLEKSAKAEGHPIDFQQDVAPWLGEKVGVFFTDLSGQETKQTAVLETTDPNAALAFARKGTGATATTPAPQTYNGATYQADPTTPGDVFGTVGNFFLEGDEAGFKQAVDAERGESLGEQSDFKDAIADLPDDRLGTFYSVPKTLIDSISAGEIDPSIQALLEKSAGASLDKPVSGALSATADSFDLDFIGGDNGAETPESSLLGTVPSDSWLALGIGNLGDVAKRSLEQAKDQIPNYDTVVQQIESTTGASLEDLEGSLGDAVLYVRGTNQSSIGGALVVQTKNPDLTGRLINQFLSLASLGGTGINPLKLNGGGSGYVITDPSVAPAPVEIAQQNDEIVIGYGSGSAEQALSPASKLADSQPFSSAKGQVSSLGTDFFLDLPKVFQYAEATGAKSDPDYLQAKPYLNALSYLISGSGSKGDQTEVKAVLGLK